MVTKKIKKKKFLFLIGKNRQGFGKKGGYFLNGNGAEIPAPREGQKIPCISDSFTILGSGILGLDVSHINESNC